MRELYTVSENYPDIKPNMLFMINMDEIVSQNENLGASIIIFNRNVQQFNAKIDMFPTNIINNMLCHLEPVDNFEDEKTQKDMTYRPNFDNILCKKKRKY